MNLIVVYDIAHPRRLQRVAKIMKDYGARVQKSIFEATIDTTRLKEMKARIVSEIEPDEDAVKIFPMCVKCAGTVEVIGQGVYIDPDGEFEVF